MQTDDTKYGTITYFDDTKGFGFIKEDGSPSDAKGTFFHFSQFQGQKAEIQKNMRVSYVVVMKERGPSAERIVRLAEDRAPRAQESESNVSTFNAMDDESDESMDEAA